MIVNQLRRWPSDRSGGYGRWPSDRPAVTTDGQVIGGSYDREPSDKPSSYGRQSSN